MNGTPTVLDELAPGQSVFAMLDDGLERFRINNPGAPCVIELNRATMEAVKRVGARLFGRDGLDRTEDEKAIMYCDVPIIECRFDLSIIRRRREGEFVDPFAEMARRGVM